MKNFVLQYHGPSDPSVHLGTAEQRADIMKEWMMWKDEMGDNLIDFGAPLTGSVFIQRNGSDTCGSTKVTGYSIVQAINIDELKVILKNHPHLKLDADVFIEVLECRDM